MSQKIKGSKQDKKDKNKRPDFQKGFKSHWEMDESEKRAQTEHLELLNEKYRDRAQERRQGQHEMKQEGNLYAGISDSEEEEQEQVIKVKGLDFDLLREQNQTLEQQQQQTKQNKETLESIKQNIFKAKQQKRKEPGVMAKKLLRIMKEQKIIQPQSFPRPFSYYRYELKNVLGNDIPNVIIKSRHQDQVPTYIPQISDHCFEKVQRVIKILKTGGRQKLREEREKIQRQKEEELKKQQQQQKQMEIEQNNDDDDDFDEDDIFCDVPKEKKKVEKNKKEPLKLLKEGEMKYDQVGEEKKEDKKERAFNILAQPEKAKPKKKNVLDEVDYYTECFQESALSLNTLKQMKNEVVKDDKKKGGGGGNQKDKLNKDFQKIEKIMKDKKRE